jgi:hypothetical protein
VIRDDAGTLEAGREAAGDAAGARGTPYLWFAGGALNAYAKGDTESSNDGGPRYVILPNNPASSFHDLVFDRVGNLWTLPVSGDQILRLPGDQLGGAVPPAPDLVVRSPALVGALGLVFDAAGSLWVLNYAGAGVSVANIVRFDAPAALSGTVTLTPSATVGPGTAPADVARFSQGTAIAFDGAGNLWLAAVANVLRLDAAAGLHGDVTASPSAVIGSAGAAYVSLAFDAGGALWITGARAGYFVMHIANPAALQGNVTPVPAATVHLPSGSALFASGMAFDAAGALWITMSDRIIELASPGALAGDVTSSPAVVLGHVGLPDVASKIVFRPQPAGLPIY